MDRSWRCRLIIVVLLLFVGGSYVSTKNTLVQKNESVNQAYSQVNVVQQRRLDLIPNLVASVKGYVNEESTILTNIANARAGVLGATDRASAIQANTKLDVALGPFFRLQEQYPNLKGSEQFTRLTMSWPAPRTASRWNVSATTRCSRTTTSTSASFPTASGRVWRASTIGTNTSRETREQCGSQGRLQQISDRAEDKPHRSRKPSREATAFLQNGRRVTW